MPTMPAPAASRHLLSSDIPARMLKADLRKAETRDFRAEIGQAIDRARLALAWNLDEFAAQVQRDSRQVKRWMAGTERPQFDALFAVAVLRGPLVIELAKLSDAIDIDTTIRVRWTA